MDASSLFLMDTMTNIALYGYAYLDWTKEVKEILMKKKSY